jgi:hypothetical protein
LELERDFDDSIVGKVVEVEIVEVELVVSRFDAVPEC